MVKYFKSVKAPRGGASIWVDGSPSATVLNTEFFELVVTTSINVKIGELTIPNIKLGILQVHKVYFGSTLIV